MLLLGSAAKKTHIWNLMNELQLCKPRMDINLLSETIKKDAILNLMKLSFLHLG